MHFVVAKSCVIHQPEAIKNLNELVKAQLAYFSAGADALSAIQGDIEELSVAAEGEYRYANTLTLTDDYT